MALPGLELVPGVRALHLTPYTLHTKRHRRLNQVHLEQISGKPEAL